MCLQTCDHQKVDQTNKDAQYIGQTLVEGNIATNGGDFVGRDKITTHNVYFHVVNAYSPLPVYSSAKKISMKLILDRSFNEYTPQDQARLLEAIRYILQVDIIITGIEQAA